EVDTFGIGVCIHHGKHGDIQLLGLRYRDMFPLNVNDEQCSGETVQIGNTAEQLLQLCLFTLHHQALALGQVQERLVLHELVDLRKLLERLTDGCEIGQHAT